MEEKEEKIENSDPPKTKSASMVYIVAAVVLLLAVGGGLYFMNKTSEKSATPEEVREVPSGAPTGRGSLSGQKFADTQLAQSAVLIYPGAMSAEAKAATSGWQLKTTQNTDGTTQASLVPVGSEATEGDSAHTFTLKTGDKLYFVDLNPSDDSPNMDNNKNDDIGIVVDANGIIQ